ncbi:hypothetical protein COO60DRAFT_434203 [Scenedesmus sp. NREL 46B-D3]|nr:hypothetical protein COO60DRAFT_434203 [Scenedesmus sp. NREL 46B-D3]
MRQQQLKCMLLLTGWTSRTLLPISCTTIRQRQQPTRHMAFECGICTSMFNSSARQPLILECGHTFCRECIQHNLGPQRWCPYCRQPINKHVDDLPRNYALENAMEAANVPLMDLMDRWGLANAERMMVKPDQLQLATLISRKGNSGEVWRGSLWGKAVAIKLLPLVGVDERQLDCLRREVAVLLHTTGECKQVCIYKGFCVKGGNFAIIMKLYSYSLAARVARHPGRRLPLPWRSSTPWTSPRASSSCTGWA